MAGSQDMMIIVVMMMMMSSVFSVLVGGGLFLTLPQEGDECEGKDDNGNYVIDEDGKCVLDECDAGYSISSSGKRCVKDVVVYDDDADGADGADGAGGAGGAGGADGAGGGPFADCKYETIVGPIGNPTFCTRACGGGKRPITYKILSEGTGGGKSCTDTFNSLPKEESCNTFPCPSSATCKAQGQNSGTCRNFPGCVTDDDGRCCLESERNEEGEESFMRCRW